MNPFWLAVYRTALFWLPRWLRRKHGVAMAGLLEAELLRSPAWLRPWVTARACADVLAEALRSRQPEPSFDPYTLSDGTWTMDAILHDLRYAFRSLVRSPGFALLAAGTLALGIGANTAIYSVVEAVILRPLPYPDADHFVDVGMDWGGGASANMPYYRVAYLGEHAATLQAVATYRPFTWRVESDGRPEGVRGLRVSPGFLEVVGYRPSLGRDFASDEAGPDGPPVALVSHSLWRERLGADPDALGGTFALDGTGYTVVGVLPADFAFPHVWGDVDLIVPLPVRPRPEDEGANYTAIARRAPGATDAQVQADLSRVWQSFSAEHPDLVGERERGYTLASFQDLYVADSMRSILWLVMGAVGMVLLIACANVANVVLARANRRSREMVVRAALGAGRGRVLRLVVFESLIVAVAAGALGVVLARWGVTALVGLSPAPIPRATYIGIDGSVLAFTFFISLVTGVIFGLAAGLPATRTGLAGALRGTRTVAEGSSRVRQGLVFAQSAFSMILLVGAGVLVASLLNLRSVDPGFDSDGVVGVTFPLSPTGYVGWADAAEMARRLQDEMPGAPVVAAANLPMQRGLNLPMEIAGRSDLWEGAVEWRAVTPGYFDLLGVEILQGRAFSLADGEGGPPVAVVSRAFAEHFFPDGDALGQAVDIGKWRGNFIDPAFDRPGAVIVGVAADVKDRSLKDEPRRTVYVPMTQAADVFVSPPVLLLGGNPPVSQVRAALTAVDPRLPEPSIRPLDQVIAASVGSERFNATLLSSFALLGLVLTALGTYALLSVVVGQRSREIGIRIALGARRSEVVKMVVGQGVWPVALGLLVGGGVAVAGSRVLSSLVWGVSATDPTTLGVVAVLLLAVAVLAAWLPAQSAARIDPVHTLTAE